MNNKSWIWMLLAISFGAAAELPHLDRMDIFELEAASDPRMAPNGKQIAYVRRSMDIMSDQPRANIWLLSTDGQSHRPLLSGPDSYEQPRWSPDGTRIAYVATVSGRGPQLFVRWLDSGQTAMLSNLRKPPQALAWSPDSTRIAFLQFVPGEGLKLADPPKPPEGAEWAAPAKVIDRLHFRSDGRGELEVGHAQVFIVPAEGGTARQLTHGAGRQQGPLSWSPDGKTIAFAANRDPDYEHRPLEADIWTVRVADGALQKLTDRDGPDFAPVYSPDGGRIAYLGFDDRRLGYQNQRVYLMDSSGGDKRCLTPEFDRSIDAVQWAGNSDSVYVQYDNRGRTLLAHWPLDGEVRVLTRDIGGEYFSRPYTSGRFSVARGGAYAYTAGSPYAPADIATGSAGQTPRRITALNADLLHHRQLGQVTELEWTSSADGLPIQGWLVKPPDFDPRRKYPLLLEIHGGPFAAYGPQFAAELQLYAAAGYVVLYANPRGSTSYGFEFANHIHHAYPGRDYDDLMSGVDAAIATGFIDSSRLFVTGGSGGGTLTAWIVGKTNRFRAAAVSKPVINWTSFVLTADEAAYFNRYWFGGFPWEVQRTYWQRSPLSLAGQVSTPTLLVTGERDLRTPMGETEQFYLALKLRKVDAALVRIPDASHGIAGRPSQLIAKVDNILAWFAKYAD